MPSSRFVDFVSQSQLQVYMCLQRFDPCCWLSISKDRLRTIRDTVNYIFMRWVASELNLPHRTKIEIGLMKKPENRDVQKKSLVMKSVESVLRLEESLCWWERITTFRLELSEQLRCRQLLVGCGQVET